MVDATRFREHGRTYTSRLASLVEGFDWPTLGAIASRFEEARAAGRTIHVAGNGGSAALASQFALDLGWGLRGKVDPRYRVVSLADNAALATALGNDVGFEGLFVEPLRATLAAGDVFVGISGSGNSPNLLRAAELARARSATTVAFTGFDGGGLRKMADLAFHVPAQPGEYALVEECHHVALDLLALHLSKIAAGHPLDTRQ